MFGKKKQVEETPQVQEAFEIQNDNMIVPEPVEDEKSKKKKKKNEVNNAQVKPRGRHSCSASVPYTCGYDNGVIQSKLGIFSKMFKFNDVQFTSLDEFDQEKIYQRYQEFLNVMGPDYNIQITFINKKTDADLILNQITPVCFGDEQDMYKKEYAKYLRESAKNNHANIITTRYITVSVKNSDTEKAMELLNRASILVPQSLTSIKGVEVEELTLEERLELYNSFYNFDIPNFYFEHDSNGKVTLDFKKIHKQGLSTRDIIAPDALRFNDADIEINDKVAQVLYINQLPNFLSTNFLKEICKQPFESIITLYINQMENVSAIKQLHNAEMGIETEISAKQDKASQNGQVAFIPHDLQMRQATVQELQEDFQNRDQKAFHFALSIAHFAEDKEELKNQKSILKQTANKYTTDFVEYRWQQERGFNNVIPWGYHTSANTRILTTETLGVLIPFDECKQTDKGGFFYGINKTNNSIIAFNRKGKQNMNALVLGSSGSGKSMNVKEELIQVAWNTKDDIVVIDPDREYGGLAKALGGAIIKIAPGNGVYLNPFDLDINTEFDQESNPLVEKIDFICGLVEIMMGGYSLNPKQKAILIKCIKKIYTPYLETLNERQSKGENVTIDRDECPTMQNLFTALTESQSPVGYEISEYIEPYVTGEFNNFAKHTNVQIDNRFIVFDLFRCSTTMKELALQVCLSEVWNRTINNRVKGKYTWSYIDECHLLLSSDNASSLLKSIWKRARKFNGLPCGITQNVEDLLQSAAARPIFNNSYYKCLMAQSDMDSEMLQDILSLSDTDMKYVTNVRPGQGLIVTNEYHVGFLRHLDDKNKVYDLLSTTMKDDDV